MILSYRCIYSIAVAAWSFVVFPAAAAEQHLTVSAAVAAALEHNGELKALQAEREIARAALTRASVWANPTLELEGESGAISGSSDESRWSVGLAQELVIGDKRSRTIAVAKGEAEELEFQIANRQRQLSLEVKQAFLESVLARQRVDLARSTADLSRQLLEVARQRFAAGDVPELEVNLARVEAARGAGRVLAAQRELPASMARLSALTGSVVSADVVLLEPPAHPPVTASADAMSRFAVTHRPDLKAAEISRATADAMMEAARADRLPNVTAGLFYSQENGVDDTGSRELATRDTLLGVRLSIPLPVFDRNQAGIQSARGHVGSTEARLGAARQAVVREVELDRTRFLASQEAVALYEKEILPLLEENLQIVREAYRLGETGILAIIDEQKNYHEVQEGYLAERHSRDLARAVLESTLAGELQQLQGEAQ